MRRSRRRGRRRAPRGCDLERYKKGLPCALPLTTAMISSAVGKLRAVEALSDQANAAFDL
jgi:hypothetical protein